MKYDFKGIKKYGAAGLKAALISTPWGATLVNVWGVGPALDIIFEWLSNWLANEGLILFNIGAINLEGGWDQKAFDKAMDDAFRKIELAGSKLTPEQAKVIDDEVIKALRQFGRITDHNQLLNVPSI